MTAQHVDVLIVGAGIAGIGTACQITAAHPGKSIAVLERRDRIGGTWDLFRYPGIRSDVDMLTLGYAFRPWREPRVTADGNTIRQYVADTAAEYRVDDKIHYGLTITGADWSIAQGNWTVTAREEATGQTREYTCGFLINCTGYYDYETGYLPQFPGVERYTGTFVHTQHWPDDLDYDGKRVVVIGSGATAVTVVPAMAEAAEHVTMLQRSPSYVFSLPGFDKISDVLSRFLPVDTVYALARKRNIFLQRKLYLASVRWPSLMRRFFLRQARRQVGSTFDMRHLTPRYMPFEERLCMALDGDFFAALRSGQASIVTDEIESFSERGVLLKSGEELTADVIVAATGLNLKMLGGIQLSVDGEPRSFGGQMTYKSLLVQDIPNFAWFFGYTNAAYTLKADIAAAYLCRLFTHMDGNGYSVATPRDTEGCATNSGVLDDFQSGYVQRSKDLMPRQGSKLPWKILMHYEKDRRMLLEDPIDDGVLAFERASVVAR